MRAGASRVSERRSAPPGWGVRAAAGEGVVAPRRAPGAGGGGSPAPRLPSAPHRSRRPVCFALYYHFQRTTNSGTSWNIWKTQISRKKRQRTGLEGLKSCPSVISTAPLPFWRIFFQTFTGQMVTAAAPPPLPSHRCAWKSVPSACGSLSSHRHLHA